MKSRRKQSKKSDRRVHVRPRRSIQPRPEKLVAADPAVVDVFDQLQTEWRHYRINHLIAPERRACAMRHHRDRENKAWSRLLEYLSSRYEPTD